jgi:hypothetical protein
MSALAVTGVVVGVLAAVVIISTLYTYTGDKQPPPRLNLDDVNEDICSPQDRLDLASDGDSDKRSLFVGLPSDESGKGRYWDAKL